ncbi:MAG: hypothetical protein NC453_29610 [Muribaculum sp.]|nr:hypothetical protein [Muribaculum sp.]
MGLLKPKNITLQAYEIERDDLKSASEDFFSLITNKWNTEQTANDRRLVLNASSSEEDVLAALTVTENYAIGAFMRISPTKDVPVIPDELFNGKTIQLAPLSEENYQPTVTVHSTSYFLICDKFLISTLPHSQIKRLQTYLNWWLSFDDKESSFKFAPMIKEPEDFKLSDMKELILGEDYAVNTEKSSSTSVHTGVKIIDLAADFIKRQVTDVPNLDELISKGIINARLYIHFSKPRKMTNEDYKSALSSYLKPIGDTEDVSIKLKQGKTVKGKDVLQSKTVSVERLDAARISEADLFGELKEFWRELNK